MKSSSIAIFFIFNQQIIKEEWIKIMYDTKVMTLIIWIMIYQYICFYWINKIYLLS